MTCGDVRECLFAFLDGELDAALSIGVQRHIEHCPLCAREVEIERAIRRQLDAVLNRQGGTSPQRALKMVMAQIRSTEVRERRSFWRRFPLGMRRVGLAAAVLVVSFGAWFALQNARAPEPTQRLADLLVADFEHFVESGKLLQLESSDPQEASGWLQERTQVATALPIMHHDHCKLVGARLCKVTDRPAAFALYEIDGEPASLVALAGSASDLRDMRMVSRGGRAHWVDRFRGHTVVATVTNGVVRAAIGRVSEEQLLWLIGTPREG